MVAPIREVFIQNEPESVDNPRYVASRVVHIEVNDEPVPKQEDIPTYVAYKAPKDPGGGGPTSDDHTPSQRADSNTTEPTIAEHLPE